MSTQTAPIPSVAFYTHIAVCPHCQKELRVASKYVGEVVNCRFCSGQLRVEPDATVALPVAYRVSAIPLETSLTAEGSVPHWPKMLEKQLNDQAQQGYHFVRAFMAGEHLGVVFELELPEGQVED